MRPAQQQYFYAHHHHQQQQQQQQQQQALQLNYGFSPVQQHNNNPPFHSPHFAQQALNGLQGGLPMGGGGGGGAMPGTQQRGGLPPLQNGLLHQQWAHLRPESQAWVSGVFPSSQQGLIQPSLVQQHLQQQQHHVAYLQEIRTASAALNGGPLSQLRGGDGTRGNQQWAHIHDGQGQFGAAPIGQDSRFTLDGMRSSEVSARGTLHGGGHSHGNGSSHNKPYDNNSRTSGNWSRGGAGAGGSGNNPRFKGVKTDNRRGGEPVRSQAISLRCDACDRTFTNSQQSTAHYSTHVKCDVQGCSFEASGRVVKEHKQLNHDSCASDMPVRSKKSLKSKESEEEVVRWRDERKRNYPTTANVKHKVEETIAKKARGELVDEDARKRRERLKEILAKQAELGVPVAEVPAYYISDRYGSLKGKDARGVNSGPGQKDNRKNAKRSHDRGNGPPDGISKREDKEPPAKVARISDGAKDSVKPLHNACEPEVGKIKEAQSIMEVKEQPGTSVLEQENISTDLKDRKVPVKTKHKLCRFHMRGQCKKGDTCEFSHECRSKKKKVVSAAKRAPTLLAKLLESDIRREKSHLLQSFRFFVNNMFLLEFGEKPLKFFDWQDGKDNHHDTEIHGQDEEAQDMDNEGTDDDKQIRDGGEIDNEIVKEDRTGTEDDMTTHRDGAQETDKDDGIGTYDDMQTSLGEQDSGDVTRLDGEAEEVQAESFEDNDREAEDGKGTHEVIETPQDEEISSDIMLHEEYSADITPDEENDLDILTLYNNLV